MFNMGVCVAVDDKIWNQPDMWQMIIFDKEKIGCGGVIYRTIEEDGRKYLVMSIQPSSRILGSCSPTQTFEKILQFSRVILKKLKYDALLIPVDAVIHSNRSSIQSEIATRYKERDKIKLKHKYAFSYNPYNYSYQEFYVVK